MALSGVRCLALIASSVWLLPSGGLRLPLPVLEILKASCSSPQTPQVSWIEPDTAGYNSLVALSSSRVASASVLTGFVQNSVQSLLASVSQKKQFLLMICFSWNYILWYVSNLVPMIMILSERLKHQVQFRHETGTRQKGIPFITCDLKLTAPQQCFYTKSWC